MFVKLRLPLVLAAGLAICLASVAIAGSPVLEQSWTAQEWSVNPSTQIPVLTLNNLDWTAGTDGAAILRLSGEVPATTLSCTNGDPYVDETITNHTPVIWTDWHVTITNGIIREAKVQKVDGNSWVVTIAQDGSGFDAVTALPTGRVNTSEQLSVWFRFDLTGAGDVSIDEYPTTEYIPEPSSLMALAMGLGTLGFFVKRRSK